ncbi:Aldehyde/histidinol dehydrogenase [Aspergillus pseudodeflectus]|uniref:Aldehyde/histidinol dehydrogenase n=1 Tax=Aspergillus pseudodeflectus TaxID=176178 RepID=A0ABR4KTL0_9EURO
MAATRLPPDAEARLPPATIGGIALPIGMFAFAWTNSPSIHWGVSIILTAPFGFGCVLVILPIMNYLIDSYTIYAASVLAAAATLRSIIGAVFPLFTAQMYHALGIHWASSVPAFLTLVCAPFPVFMWRYGAAVRSKYQTWSRVRVAELLAVRLERTAGVVNQHVKPAQGRGRREDELLHACCTSNVWLYKVRLVGAVARLDLLYGRAGRPDIGWGVCCQIRADDDMGREKGSKFNGSAAGIGRGTGDDDHPGGRHDYGSAQVHVTPPSGAGVAQILFHVRERSLDLLADIVRVDAALFVSSALPGALEHVTNSARPAGLPPGVVNIFPGLGSVAGRALAEHGGVDKIAFTGSTATGQSVMKAAAGNLKNITPECGGKGPVIVFEDADLEQAVKWCHTGIMDNQGQVYVSTSRIYVHEKVYNAFMARFIEVTKENQELGGAFAKDVHQGSQVSKAQYDKILSYIEQGKAEGATLFHGGARANSRGYFIQSTVFGETNGKHGHNARGNLRPRRRGLKFPSEKVIRPNDTPYGLAAAVFAQNISDKASGIGTELGEYAIHAYTQAKAVRVNPGVQL